LPLPIRPRPFTLAFLDPPYGRGLAPRTLQALLDGGRLAEEALIPVEAEAHEPLLLPEGVAEAERRRYGDTQIVIARLA
jgi:16S rRNA (guanine966-N2)-methyltransferase